MTAQQIHLGVLAYLQMRRERGDKTSIRALRAVYGLSEYLIAKASLGHQSWFKVPRCLIRRTEIRPADKLFLIALLDIWNEVGQEDWFYATNERLMIQTGLNLRTVIAARKRMVKINLIGVKPGDRNWATRYYLSEEITNSLKNKTPLKTITLVRSAEVHDDLPEPGTPYSSELIADDRARHYSAGDCERDAAEAMENEERVR